MGPGEGSHVLEPVGGIKDSHPSLVPLERLSTPLIAMCSDKCIKYGPLPAACSVLFWRGANGLFDQLQAAMR